MSVYLHIVLQLLGFVVMAGTALTNTVPSGAQKYVILAVSASQGFLAWYNHFYTPDGKKLPGA